MSFRYRIHHDGGDLPSPVSFLAASCQTLVEQPPDIQHIRIFDASDSDFSSPLIVDLGKVKIDLRMNRQCKPEDLNKPSLRSCQFWITGLEDRFVVVTRSNLYMATVDFVIDRKENKIIRAPECISAATPPVVLGQTLCFANVDNTPGGAIPDALRFLDYRTLKEDVEKEIRIPFVTAIAPGFGGNSLLVCSRTVQKTDQHAVKLLNLDSASRDIGSMVLSEQQIPCGVFGRHLQGESQIVGLSRCRVVVSLWT